MAMDVPVIREVVERVCARQDVLDACKRRDLGAVITLFTPSPPQPFASPASDRRMRRVSPGDRARSGDSSRRQPPICGTRLDSLRQILLKC